MLNHHPFYFEQRPLNSIEILSYLKVAEHITGDAKYGHVFDELIEKHHYLLNALLMRRGTTGQWPDINHSDDELLYLAYYPLLRLEKDPSRRRILTESIAPPGTRAQTASSRSGPSTVLSIILCTARRRAGGAMSI